VEEVILLDSSVIVAYHHRGDSHHGRAAEILGAVFGGEWGAPLVPEYVVNEVLTVVLARTGLGVARRAGRHLLQAVDLEIVPCMRYMHRALEIFGAQRSRQLSFTDCTIVAISRSEGIEHVATFDRALGRVRGIRAVPG
jgi:predicted nucleic acid-binding protein